MPRRDGSTSSEEFAWESREFLRKLAVGRKCMFRVDYKVDSISREFGSVFVEREGERLDVGLVIARAGWARVRGSSDTAMQSPDIDALRAAAAVAEAHELGIYTADADVRALSVYTFDTVSACEGGELVAARGRGTVLPAVVDAVLSGSTLKIITLDTARTIITFALAGAQAPKVLRNSDGTLTGDPGALEAKALTELRVLGREVRAVLLSGEGSRVYGELVYAADDAPASLAATLLEEGLAKYVDWSARLLPLDNTAVATGAALRKLELAAQAAAAGIWKDGAPRRSSPGDGSGTTIVGKVVEVVSGDTVVVRAAATGAETRVSLASVRAPRLRPGGAAEAEPHARDAKDFVRKHAIGASVIAVVEFERSVVPGGATAAGAGGATDAPVVTMQMGNVELAGAQGPQQLAEMVVRRGFAKVQPGREGDERSSIFGALLTAEEYARGKRLGLHSGKDTPPPRFNDVSAPGNAARAKQYLPFFQRHGSMPCQVEAVLSGTRLKLLSPKDSVVFVFSPSGVRAPSRGAPARGGQPAVPPEPFGEDAHALVRKHFMQRNVSVQVESVDRNGTFLGRVAADGRDLSLLLLTAGLGKLHPTFSADRVVGASGLQAAEREAQEARRGIWHDYNPDAAEDAAEGAGDVATGDATQNSRRVVVSHVAAADAMHLQSVDEPRLKWVSNECAVAGMVPFDGWGGAPAPRAGSRVVAQFSADSLWYRGYVERVLDAGTKNAAAVVYFIDYGNSERVAMDKMRPLPPPLAAVAPLATLARLAYVRLPGLTDDEWGVAAATELAACVAGGRTLTAQRVMTSRGAGGGHPRDAGAIEHVLLFPEGSEGELAASVNAQMLEAGLARLPKPSSLRHPVAREAVEALGPAQDKARRTHAGMFCYGDPGDSDEEL